MPSSKSDPPSPSAASNSSDDSFPSELNLSACPALEGSVNLMRAVSGGGGKPSPGLVREIVNNIPDSHLIPGTEVNQQFETAMSSLERNRSNSQGSESSSRDGASLSSNLDAWIWNSLFEELTARREKIEKEGLSKVLKEGTKVSSTEERSDEPFEHLVGGQPHVGVLLT